ncbi:MAG: hypothetical protein KFH98_13590, partial [Gemmatimonadetes bacterium]|nr:hypothetical protein [Gemmatimonadota bacterium]
MSRLLDAAGDAPFVFVAGKGGVGKTTVAGALALEFADSGTPVHLISTDPAHSLADLLQHPVGGDAVESPCSSLLRVEEFDASRAAGEWLDSALGPVSGIVESGTYLDGDDVAAFSHLALPGIDEMMAVLRLVELLELADGTRVVVDTAPTGHTLRLLDAADTHEGIADALRAMADKAAAVAGAMTGRAVRMKGEDIIDRLDRTVTAYRGQVLAPAAFVVARRAGDLVEAETRRLVAELDRRGLRVAALLTTGPAGSEEPEAGAPGQEGHTGSGRVPHPVLLEVPLLAGVAGCDGLRMWRRHVTAVRGSTPGPGPAPPPGPGPAPPPDGTPSAISPPVWLAGAAGRLLLFAGKGGVGKSTCAAAAAVALAETRDVLLCSTDPAGSLGDLLVDPGERLPDRLRVLQIEPAAQLERLRDAYQEEVVAALEHLGLTQSAALDRRVIGTLWNLSP